MKKLLLALALMTFGLSAQAYDHDRSHVVRVTGNINLGPYINCEITNHDPYAFYQVLNYHYAISFVNRWNQVQVDHQYLTCQFGCDVHSYRTVRLTGPRNGRNVVGARCDVTLRVFDLTDPNDDYDDYPLTRMSGGDSSQGLN